MSNKVTFGLEKVHVAFMLTASTWDTPIPIPGAVRFTPTPQGEESTFYADNGPYFTVTANNGYTAELEMALVPDVVLKDMLGWEIDDNGMLVEIADGAPKEFALMGQVLGDAKNRRFVYYRCKAARPGKEHATKGESTEPATDVLNLTILPIEVAGKSIVKGVMELGDTNAAAYNAFFDAVTVPDAIPGSVDKTGLAATIALAGTLEEADYTAPSWTAMQAKLTAANAVNVDAKATQQEVNAANADLQAAILALVPA